MSTKVVTAPASEAKRPVRSHKPAKQAAEQAAVNEDEARAADDDSEQDVSVAPVEKEGETPVQSETSSSPSEASMAGEFTFGSALAEAAAASGSLVTDAEEADEVGFGQFGDGDGSTPLLIGAVALAALGLVFILKDGGDGDDDVTPVNTAPTITAPANVTTEEDSNGVTIAKPVTADADGDTVTVTATSPNGTLTQNTDGSFTFKPNANFNGTATVTFTASDGTASATTTSTVTVTPVADPPTITAPAAATTAEDTPLNIAAPATADPDGDTVTVTATSTNGTVVKNADGSFTFTPAEDFNGDAVITYSATDGTSPAVTTTQTITVTPVNDPAVLSPLAVDAFENTALNLSDLLVITDVDGDAGDAVVEVTGQPESGEITTLANGDVIYTPDADFIGTDTVTFSVTDDEGLEEEYTVTITVAEGNPAVSIDVPPSGPAVVFDAGDGDFVFTDAVNSRTDVILQNFSDGDTIVVTGADADDYNFGTRGTGAFADDLRITFNDGTNFTQIIIEDVIQGGFVFDAQSAATAIGIDNFITFG